MAHHSENDEVLDLVDQNDQVIGTIHRGEAHSLGPEVGYIRAAEAFVMNSDGKLWTPVRALTKTISPGGYDFGCAEHVGTAETYDDAMVRGFDEELNLHIGRSKLAQLGILPPHDDINYFRAIYLYKTDKTPDYNKDDFISYEWLTPDQIRANIANGTPAKSTIPEALTLLEKHL